MTWDLYMPNEDWEGNKQQERGRESEKWKETPLKRIETKGNINQKYQEQQRQMTMATTI